MSAQRAIGSTVGFAVLGSVLAAWLSTTLDPHLGTAVPDPVERRTVAAAIIASANPRAHVAETGPRQPIVHRDPIQTTRVVKVAERDFIQGIQVALLVVTAMIAMLFLAGWRWFPHSRDAMGSDAEREAAMVAGSE